MLSATSASALIAVYWRVSSRIAFWSSVCRSEEHTSELQSLTNLVCRLLLEKKKNTDNDNIKRVERNLLLSSNNTLILTLLIIDCFLLLTQNALQSREGTAIADTDIEPRSTP